MENYRPISLLSHAYKLLVRMMTNRVKGKSDQYQSVDQAGFYKGYSTLDHLQMLKLRIEKANKYNIQLHLAFIEFKKAFDSVEIWAFLSALNDARVDSRCSQLIKNIYETATFCVG